MRDLYMLEAFTDDGLKVLTGPMTIATAMAHVDEYLTPGRWRHRYRPVTPLAQAVRHWTATGHNPEPVVEADFFAALRRAIICDPQRDGLDDHVVTETLAHVDPHRPCHIWQGDEECVLHECGHQRNDDGSCEGMERAERLCVACTAIVDSRSEFGPHYPIRVTWPCSVISAAASQYNVALTVPA